MEVVGARKNGRERETRLTPYRAPVLFCAHYFQARATQAKICPNKSSSDCHSCWMLKINPKKNKIIRSFQRCIKRCDYVVPRAMN